jgi:hypothetical protein
VSVKLDPFEVAHRLLLEHGYHDDAMALIVALRALEARIAALEDEVREAKSRFF